jgi:shikimate kinase
VASVVILIGPKHCGKSSIAFALKKLLDCRAGDLDTIIEKRTGKSVRELFLESPEVFRDEEADKLSFVLQKENENKKNTPLILASGGGIIENKRALKTINRHKNTILVYIETSAETAWCRIKNTADKTGSFPPFIEKDNPQTSHRELHERRAEMYKKIAHFTINAENKTPETIAEEIIKKSGLKQFKYYDS